MATVMIGCSKALKKKKKSMKFLSLDKVDRCCAMAGLRLFPLVAGTRNYNINNTYCIQMAILSLKHCTNIFSG